MLIAVVVISGYLLPWSLGDALDVFGVGIPSPMDGNQALHDALERMHDVAGHLFIPLLALHVSLISPRPHRYNGAPTARYRAHGAR